MSVAELLEHWTAQGVEFAVDGADVVFDAPTDVDLDALADALRPRKHAIVAYLSGRGGEQNTAATAVADGLGDDVRDDGGLVSANEDDAVAETDPPAHLFDASVLEGLGSWDDEAAVPWTSESKHCPRCGSAATWESAASKTRCTICAPPERSRRMLEEATQIRRRLRIAPPLCAVALCEAMRGRRYWRSPDPSVTVSATTTDSRSRSKPR